MVSCKVLFLEFILGYHKLSFASLMHHTFSAVCSCILYIKIAHVKNHCFLNQCVSKAIPSQELYVVSLKDELHQYVMYFFLLLVNNYALWLMEDMCYCDKWLYCEMQGPTWKHALLGSTPPLRVWPWSISMSSLFLLYSVGDLQL